MPPSNRPRPSETSSEGGTPFDPTDHLLPRPSEASGEGGTQGKKSSAGPVAGIVIIIGLMVIGGLYFWGAELNQQPQDPPPYIPADNSSPTGT